MLRVPTSRTTRTGESHTGREELKLIAVSQCRDIKWPDATARIDGEEAYLGAGSSALSRRGDAEAAVDSEPASSEAMYEVADSSRERPAFFHIDMLDIRDFR